MTAPMPGGIDLESVLSAEKDARAQLVTRPDPMSTAVGEGSRRSASSQSAAEQAVGSLVDTEALRRG